MVLEDGTDIYDVPEFYDAEYFGYKGDFAFYRSVCQKLAVPRVLEFGSGTGRLTFELARAGLKVHGVDVAPFMLRQAWSRLDNEDEKVRSAVTFVRGHIRSYRGLRRGYGAVVASFNTLQHLNTAELKQALETVKFHLQENGRFAADVFAPVLPANASHDADFVNLEKRALPHVDKSLWVDQKVTFDDQTALLTTQYRYRQVSPEGRPLSSAVRTLVQRQWSQKDLAELLAQHGFASVEWFGDVDMTPYTPSSPRILFSAYCEK
jgi:SAM-dependent methyltransferase